LVDITGGADEPDATNYVLGSMAGLCVTVTGNAMVFYALAHVFEIQVFVMA
jgi:hypothetical protein